MMRMKICDEVIQTARQNLILINVELDLNAAMDFCFVEVDDDKLKSLKQLYKQCGKYIALFDEMEESIRDNEKQTK